MPPPAGLVTPCGQSTTIWKLAEIFGLADPLHTRVASGMPVFGSCAGMIMLACRSCFGAGWVPGRSLALSSGSDLALLV